MPAPIIPQNKFKEQFENNIDLRNKMQSAFLYAYDSLSNNPLGALDTFTVSIDGIVFEYVNGGGISINGKPYSDLVPNVKTQAYNRLEKFMKIALERYNIQYNL
jgi:hypothetical protein